MRRRAGTAARGSGVEIVSLARGEVSGDLRKSHGLRPGLGVYRGVINHRVLNGANGFCESSEWHMLAPFV